ncbi:MAG: TetR/AcrR family transcriptional regulator [Marinifilum sp.]|jgi:AcrR family transcriptional regulator|nr:TetR/AcrR family transcriptional regulator [Marinifilum sp.]
MRKIDTNKIERIKVETKKLIVERGYHGASIAEIARRAQVSDGYLYRHYSNKSELVRDIFEKQLKQFHDFIIDLLDQVKTVEELTGGIIDFLFNLSDQEPYAIQFAHMLVYDHEFEYPKSRHEAISEIMDKILKLGASTYEISDRCTQMDILLTILTIPVKYIEYSKKGYGSFSDKESIKENLVMTCMNALK